MELNLKIQRVYDLVQAVTGATGECLGLGALPAGKGATEGGLVGIASSFSACLKLYLHFKSLLCQRVTF